MVEEMSGMTRVKSSLELLSHTASLKSEIDALEEMSDRMGRVSPAASTGGGGGDYHCGATNHHHVSPTLQDRIFVSPKDTANAIAYGMAVDSGYSIEGYEASASTTELSPIPSQPADTLSEYLSRGNQQQGGGAAGPANLPASISASVSSSFLLKFSPSSKALEGLGGSSYFLPGSSCHGSRDDAESNFGGVGLRGGGGSSPATLLGSAGTTDLMFARDSSAKGTQQLLLENENADLRKLVASKDNKIAALEAQVEALEKQVADLRQLPTGKISQIPIEDMLQLMREYGSELSETAVPPRKDAVQKASVVRQFRRWNPTFFEHFYHKGGKWVPKLGKKGELERRAKLRASAASSSAPAKKPTKTLTYKAATTNAVGEETVDASFPTATATGRRGGTVKSFNK